jgi:pimeloyl-[acyl-carrier protein] synthase
MQPHLARTLGEGEDAKLSLLQLFDPQVLADPHAFYRILRERDPVHWDPYTHTWVVTSYREVVTVLTSYSADRAPSADYLDRVGLSFMKPFAEMMRQQMLFMDPPMHSRLRGLCSAAFTPRKVEELRLAIQSVVDDLIDKVIASSHLDVVADLAIPLPAIITAKLMGIPVEDHRQLGSWASDIAEVHGNFQNHPDRVTEVVQSLRDMKVYLTDRMRELRKRPNEGLIYSLMVAETDGQRLTDDEVIASAIVTIIGGHETTTNLLGSGCLTLLRNPNSLDHLRSHPEIVTSAVEELLRYESPVQHTARIAPADMELAGKSIAKGTKVVAVLAAANRDPNRFRDPDLLDLCRVDNRHLAFGWAGHFCFGAPLARMEAQIAFNSLLHRLSRPCLLDETLEWRANAGLRGLTALNVSFDPGILATRG